MLTYLIAESGLLKREVKVTCRDGASETLPIVLFRRVVYAAYHGYWYSCKMRTILAKGFIVPVNELRDTITDALINGWLFDLNKRCWVKGSVKFRHVRLSVIEVFDRGVYAGVDVRNRVVVDVGAYVGDSAIFFALKGAEKVIAIEPHPEAYREMLENIRLNRLEDKIITLNCAIGGRAGFAEVPRVDISTALGVQAKEAQSGEVPMITLDEVTERFGIERGF